MGITCIAIASSVQNSQCTAQSFLFPSLGGLWTVWNWRIFPSTVRKSSLEEYRAHWAWRPQRIAVESEGSMLNQQWNVTCQVEILSTQMECSLRQEAFEILSDWDVLRGLTDKHRACWFRLSVYPDYFAFSQCFRILFFFFHDILGIVHVWHN